MKRSRSDAIKGTLNAYLKRRHYTGPDEYLIPATQPCSPEEMAVNCAVDRVVGRSNSFTFSLINNDMTPAEQHFVRFKNWVAELKQETFQCELASLLCPMFCHIYLEMLWGGHRQSASKFFKRYQSLFTREHNRVLLEELANVTSFQEIESNNVVKDFRSCKYHVKLSEPAMYCLQAYLTKHGHIILINILQNRFSLEVDGTIWPIEDRRTGSDKDNDVEPSCEEENNQEKGADSSSLEDDFRIVREALEEAYDPPVTPVTVLYTVNNCEEIVPCGRFTKKLDKLAVGVGSVVQLWSLTNEKLRVPPKHTLLPMFGSEDESEDEDHEDDIPEKEEADFVSLYGHFKGVQDLGFIYEGQTDRLLLSVSQDTTMRCWKMEDNTCVAIYRGHNSPIWCVDVDALGLFAVTGSSDTTAKIWSINNTFPLRVLIGHTQDVECVSYHPSCKYVATGSTDRTVRLWTVSEGRLIRVYVGHRGAVQAVACSPNGKYIASTGEDKRIKIWDIMSATTVAEFKGHTNCVVSLSWTPNSEYLASCSMDRTIRQWNVVRCLSGNQENEGEELRAESTATATSQGSEAPPSPAEGNSDSALIASSSSQNTAVSELTVTAVPSVTALQPAAEVLAANVPSNDENQEEKLEDAAEGSSKDTTQTCNTTEPVVEVTTLSSSSSPSQYQTACFTVGDHILSVQHLSKDLLASVKVIYANR